MQIGFGNGKYFNIKQKIIWIHFWGVHQWSTGSENCFEPTKTQAINWYQGDRDAIVKMHFSILFCWLVSLDLMIMQSDVMGPNWWVNTGSGSGLVQPCNKPLPD